MNEKRFRPVSCVTDWYIEDKKTSSFAVLTPHQASDLLNELHEENEELKQQLKEHKSTLSGQSNKIFQLKKENEYLKRKLEEWVK